MQVNRVEVGGVTVAELHGSLDVHTAASLESILGGWIAAGASPILVDLAGVERMFSSGLAAMLALHRAADAAGGRILFTAPRPFIREVLRITLVDRVVALVPDRDTGLALLQR